MSYLVVVDVGIKNMGLLVYDLNTKRVCLWERVDITKGIKYVPSNNVSYIHTLIDKHAQYFANAHMVIVERQMRVNMRVIEAVFQSRFFDKCKVINAQSVKMHFSISMRNYKQNKKKSRRVARLPLGHGLIEVRQQPNRDLATVGCGDQERRPCRLHDHDALLPKHLF
jgi:hypothetical protein